MRPKHNPLGYIAAENKQHLFPVVKHGGGHVIKVQLTPELTFFADELCKWVSNSSALIFGILVHICKTN